MFLLTLDKNKKGIYIKNELCVTSKDSIIQITNIEDQPRELQGILFVRVHLAWAKTGIVLSSPEKSLLLFGHLFSAKLNCRWITICGGTSLQMNHFNETQTSFTMCHFSKCYNHFIALLVQNY